MIRIKKIASILTSVLLFLAICIGFVLCGQVNSAKAMAESGNARALSVEELNQKITDTWGSPTDADLVVLKDDFTETDLGTSGDKWLYLTSDIKGDIAYTKYRSSGHLRILLNGYSISGTIRYISQYSNATVSVFDKIPDKSSGTGYTYNTSPERYYSYSMLTGRYSVYTSVKPSGIDVTNMPTFKLGSYIKVTGAAFSPNAVSTTADFYLSAWQTGNWNVFNVNFVGANSSMAFIMGTLLNGNINLYHCNFIGNKVGNRGVVGVWHSGGSIHIEGCNIYGNQSDEDTGIQPANTSILGNEADVFNCNGEITLVNSNIGALTDGEDENDYTQAVYLKDVDFGFVTLIITPETIATFFKDVTGATGTIELVYNVKAEIDGANAGLNFILHGGTSSTVPYKGGNTLTVNTGASIGNISTAFETEIYPAGDITLFGRVGDITTRGKVILEDGSQFTAISNTATIINNRVAYNVERATIVLGENIVYFNGAEHRPVVVVYFKDKLLIENVDYTVAYSNNTRTGTATVTVTGIREYSGIANKTFTIMKKGLSGAGLVWTILGTIFGGIALGVGGTFLTWWLIKLFRGY